jgi:hypothetical protein
MLPSLANLNKTLKKHNDDDEDDGNSSISPLERHVAATTTTTSISNNGSSINNNVNNNVCRDILPSNLDENDENGLPRYRTVINYETDAEIQAALMKAVRVLHHSVEGPASKGNDMDSTVPQVLIDIPMLDDTNITSNTNTDIDDISYTTSSSSPPTLSTNDDMIHSDWILTSTDRRTTEPQSMKEEIRRLQVLKSYQLLDSDIDATFDVLTDISSRVFNVPIALVNLIDLGRYVAVKEKRKMSLVLSWLFSSTCYW